MRSRSTLPKREHVFLLSLQYHGFRYTRRRKNLKKRCGYIIPATRREDSGGIDFWVKMPKESVLVPVQITQRGVRLFRKYERNLTDAKLVEYIKTADMRLHAKRMMCRENDIAFVLVRDYDGTANIRAVAWGDKKALLHAIVVLYQRKAKNKRRVL